MKRIHDDITKTKNKTEDAKEETKIDEDHIVIRNLTTNVREKNKEKVVLIKPPMKELWQLPRSMELKRER